MTDALTHDDLELIAKRFRRARHESGLDRVECTRKAGYQNVDKGLRRLDAIEGAEPPIQAFDVYRRFSRVLDIDLTDLWDDVRAQRRARADRDAASHPSWLGLLIRRRRQALSASIEDILEQMDDSDSWTSRRLEALESGAHRFATPSERRDLTDALELTPQDIEAAQWREFTYYDRLEGSPSMIVRLIPGFYNAKSYPESFNTAQLLEHAREFSAERQLRCCVVMPDRRSVYINGPRQSETFEPPSMRIGHGQTTVGILPPLQLDD